MEKNKIIIYLAIIAIIILLVVPTISKINKNHIEKSYIVASKKISEAAEDCYYKKDCTDNKITLEELIKKDYLSSMINPKNDEYFNNKSYVILDISNNTSELHLY